MTDKQPEDGGSRGAPGGRRPPDYVIVIASSDWLKERSPAARANFWDALRSGKDRHRDSEPDLEAEP
jgi:hypothetical protein